MICWLLLAAWSHSYMWPPAMIGVKATLRSTVSRNSALVEWLAIALKPWMCMCWWVVSAPLILSHQPQSAFVRSSRTAVLAVCTLTVDHVAVLAVSMESSGILITIRPGAGVSYRRLPARCWIQKAVTQISGTIRLCHTTLQQHVRRQIICSSRGTTFLLPFATPSWQWTLSANISKLFRLVIREVAAHPWHFDIIAPFINVLYWLTHFDDGTIYRK